MKKYERPFLVTTIPAVEGNDCGAEIYDLVTSEVGKKNKIKWCVCQGGGGAGGIDWEVGASRCKLLYTGWINNKILLCSTGNYIQYPVISHNGKECWKRIFKNNICLTFKSLIHFEFIFVCSVRKCSSFMLLQVFDQISQHHLLKRLSFLHCIFLPPLSKIRCP